MWRFNINHYVGHVKSGIIPLYEVVQKSGYDLDMEYISTMMWLSPNDWDFLYGTRIGGRLCIHVTQYTLMYLKNWLIDSFSRNQVLRGYD